jgi:hypothetical protein
LGFPLVSWDTSLSSVSPGLLSKSDELKDGVNSDQKARDALLLLGSQGEPRPKLQK